LGHVALVEILEGYIYTPICVTYHVDFYGFADQWGARKIYRNDAIDTSVGGLTSADSIFIIVKVP